MKHPSRVLAAREPGNPQPVCCLANGDCAGRLQRDHVGYSSVSQQEVFQWLCYYHICMEARELHFFVASQVQGEMPLPRPVRIELNEWHIKYRLHPKLKKRIHELSEEHPLPKKIIPGQGQRAAAKEIVEGQAVKFKWKPDLREGKILGF